ncbi:hypothetical protein LTR36_010173 [Oleoguttula mirabilis]|uniref:HTH La-type RNA-binding domain-containing protein n=1 Tax=Oleoguttula mirabilis TaxID=1507867 RepID=A0AAV9JS44_9PEZI|nr:hypothetical protein LTR36_010173 [Oleoguttula mirabilis]
MSRASSIGRKALRHDVKGQPPPAVKPHQLLTFTYQPNPGPVNCTTLRPTIDFATDDFHPFHIRTKRKLDAFDPTKLHWRVQCPTDVSSKSLIRNWATKRLRNAFAQRLLEGGWEKDGSPLKRQGDGGSAVHKESLSGALLMVLHKSDITLTASKEAVQYSARWVLDLMLRRREEALRKQPRQQELVIRHIHSNDPTASPAGPASSYTPKAQTTAIPLAKAAAAALDDKDIGAIRRQVEYYFSDTNLPTDTFMLNLTGGVANRPVSLKTICDFNRMRSCTYSAVKDALASSKRLQLVEADGTDAVRRRRPIDARQFTRRSDRPPEIA